MVLKRPTEARQPAAKHRAHVEDGQQLVGVGRRQVQVQRVRGNVGQRHKDGPLDGEDAEGGQREARVEERAEVGAYCRHGLPGSPRLLTGRRALFGCRVVETRSWGRGRRGGRGGRAVGGGVGSSDSIECIETGPHEIATQEQGHHKGHYADRPGKADGGVGPSLEDLAANRRHRGVKTREVPNPTSSLHGPLDLDQLSLYVLGRG